MATIGLDCDIIIDGTGYFVRPGNYTVKTPRIRKATVRADAGESYIDLGPGRREWGMIDVALCQRPVEVRWHQHRSDVPAVPRCTSHQLYRLNRNHHQFH